MSDKARHIRTPDELFEFACAWIRKTGWPTHAQDLAVADGVYAKWIQATDAEFAATGTRDFELLCSLLRTAYADTHDEEALDALQILMLNELTLRGREERRLKRERIH